MNDDPSSELINALGALWHPDDNPEPKEDRNAVEATLQRLADGSTDQEDLAFMRQLARCLIAAGGKWAPPARRADAVLRAAGLGGRYQHTRAFVDHATQLEGFDGYTKAGAIRDARAAGLLPHSVDDSTARKRLDKPRKG